KGEKKKVWGEDCRGRMHFDCVGLVNWAIAKTFNKPLWTFDLDKYREGLKGKVEAVLVNAPGGKHLSFLPADIFLNPHHIAFATGAGTVIEAASTDLGVQHAGMDLGNYDKVLRITDAGLRQIMNMK